jgi:small subunit ribosomal protein S35
VLSGKEEVNFDAASIVETTTNNLVMATALQGVRLAARGCKCRPATHNYAVRAIGRRRLFSTTTVRCEDQGKEDLDSATSAALAKAAKAPDAERGQILEQELTHLGSRIERFKESSTNSLRNRIRAPKFPWERRFERPPNTFLNDEEDEAIDGYPEEDGDDDADLTSLGHGELEHHREMRHYARLAAWEMPMLSSMSFHTGTHKLPMWWMLYWAGGDIC